jgi:biofilm protein TabA
MIVDDISNWQAYFKKPFWETLFTEIMLLNKNTPDMEKKILHDDIILKIFSYDTVAPEDERAELESHRKYIDIHTTITQSERIDWYPVSVLKTKKPYNEAEDAIYYEKTGAAGASINMYPGIFAAFWPEDAHMPRIMANEQSTSIKKVVCKIKIDLIR